jgi:pyocin large subunit-like protein
VSAEKLLIPEGETSYDWCELHGAVYLDEPARREQVEGVASILSHPGVGYETSIRDEVIVEVAGPLTEREIDTLEGLAARSIMDMTVLKTGETEPQTIVAHDK